MLRFLQELGLSLEEIKQLLVLRRTEKVVCPEVQKFLKSKIKEVKQKMVTLQRLEADLKRALRQCQRELRRAGAPASAECCPVLQSVILE